MGHNISAIILKGDYDNVKAEEYDLIGMALPNCDLTMFHINHYYSAYWQAKLGTDGHLYSKNIDYILFPNEQSIAYLISLITGKQDALYAIIATDYFGGIGNQWANVYQGDLIVDLSIKSINDALYHLGVRSNEGMDEFDTVGLSGHRSEPEYLEKYIDLADQMGV